MQSKSKKLKLSGGASRTDDVKARHELIPPILSDLLAERFALGAKNHGVNNWKDGGADFILSCFGWKIISLD